MDVKNSSSKEIIKLNEDQVAIASKAINEIFHGLKFLKEEIPHLTKDIRFNVLSVIKSEFQKLSAILDTEEDEKQKSELEKKLLRKVNFENRRLREEMAKGVTVDSIGAKLYELEQIVYKWWQDLGFSYSKHSILPGPTINQLKTEFSVTLERGISYSERENNPVSARKKKKEKVQALGKELQILESAGENYVLDNENNKTWLINKLKNRFPNIRIFNIKIHSIYNREEFQITDIEAYIDIKEI